MRGHNMLFINLKCIHCDIMSLPSPSQEERKVTYSVDGAAYSVWVPAAEGTPNFLFYSCNGEAGADSGAVAFAEKSASVRCCVGS